MMGKAIKQIVLDAIQKTLEESQSQKENIYLQFSLQQLELLKIKGVKFWELLIKRSGQTWMKQFSFVDRQSFIQGFIRLTGLLPT